jgi:S-DNA-T family DNA segregation ATPase FtsK/SpoIIIE
VDSRTILDQNGAEALLGNGDMLFLPPGKSEPQRIQGAYIATEETEKLMAWFESRKVEAAAARASQEDDILEVIRAQETEGDDEGGATEPGERDALFRQAAEICIQNLGGSTSLLQRRMKIATTRVSTSCTGGHSGASGARGREVLIGIHQLDEYT